MLSISDVKSSSDLFYEPIRSLIFVLKWVIKHHDLKMLGRKLKQSVEFAPTPRLIVET